MELRNEERRQILRGQHAHLRRTIEAAQTTARSALAGKASPGELQFAVTALERELLAHLAEEERLLEPILARLDAWGPTRVSLLHAEHAHQRAVLAVLTGRSAWPASTLVAGRTLSMCDDLIIDMEFEERELLNERVLRDDLIVLDASDA
ncbi:MAG: hemerythrin domain-containing protein [Deltaproteobacteria bacterium]|nr:MAG: hemerythrin domain-containing protein [Deltaproteobacteria bacterium]